MQIFTTIKPVAHVDFYQPIFAALPTSAVRVTLRGDKATLPR